MAPKLRSSDAGSSDLPKRTLKVLLLSERVKVINLIKRKKGKESYAQVAKIYGENKSSSRKIEEKEILLVLLLHLKL